MANMVVDMADEEANMLVDRGVDKVADNCRGG